MKGPGCIFRLDRQRRFLRARASPATRSCGQIVGDPVEGKQLEDEDERRGRV